MKTVKIRQWRFYRGLFISCVSFSQVSVCRSVSAKCWRNKQLNVMAAVITHVQTVMHLLDVWWSRITADMKVGFLCQVLGLG